jgi:hypothetical protein
LKIKLHVTFVFSELQADQDKALGFSHVFQLRPEGGGAFFIMHEIFRLAVFNYPG